MRTFPGDYSVHLVVHIFLLHTIGQFHKCIFERVYFEIYFGSFLFKKLTQTPADTRRLPYFSRWPTHSPTMSCPGANLLLSMDMFRDDTTCVDSSPVEDPLHNTELEVQKAKKICELNRKIEAAERENERLTMELMLKRKKQKFVHHSKPWVFVIWK